MFRMVIIFFSVHCCQFGSSLLCLGLPTPMSFSLSWHRSVELAAAAGDISEDHQSVTGFEPGLYSHASSALPTIRAVLIALVTSDVLSVPFVTHCVCTFSFTHHNLLCSRNTCSQLCKVPITPDLLLQRLQNSTPSQ